MDMEQYKIKRLDTQGDKVYEVSAWTPDGEIIIYYDDDDNIQGVKRNNGCLTGNFHVFVEGKRKGIEIYPWFGFSWSPDGNTIAAAGRLVEDDLWGVFLIDANTDLITDWLHSGTCAE